MTDEAGLEVQGELFPADSVYHSEYELARRNQQKAVAVASKEKKRGAAFRDLTGERFGYLMVEYATDERHHAGVVFLCRCDCGRTIKVTARHLQRKVSPTTHCGCRGVYRGRRSAPGTRGIGVPNALTKSNPKTAFNSLFAQYRSLASSRGIQWKLSKPQFWELVNGDCHYCGIEPTQVFTRNIHSFVYNGVDRVDSSKAYSPDNCVPCCGTCNMAKKELTVEEFAAWLERAYHYFVE